MECVVRFSAVLSSSMVGLLMAAGCDPGDEGCVPVDPPELLLDLGDRRVYRYEETITDTTFSEATVDSPTQEQYVAYLEEIDAAWQDADVFSQPALLERQRDVFISAGYDGTRWNRLLDGEVGELTDAICIQSIMFDQQNQDFPLWDAETELGAAVLQRHVDGEEHLRAYFVTQDGQTGVGGNEYLNLALNDHEHGGWGFLAHLHSHYYAPDGPSDIAGTTIPSDPDLASYNNWKALYGVKEAWITNGIHSLKLLAEEFDDL